MGKVLVVVDMQKDFIDGTLGTKEAEMIVSGVQDKIRTFDGTVVATRDTHGTDYLDTQEGKKLPVAHCLKDSEGWEIEPGIQSLLDSRRAKVFDKPAFGSVKLAEYLKAFYEKNEIDEIELVGLCTDICVISNAMLIKAYLPEVPVSVDSACCAGVTPRSHENALEAMKMCQIIVK